MIDIPLILVQINGALGVNLLPLSLGFIILVRISFIVLLLLDLVNIPQSAETFMHGLSIGPN